MAFASLWHEGVTFSRGDTSIRTMSKQLSFDGCSSEAAVSYFLFLINMVILSLTRVYALVFLVGIHHSDIRFNERINFQVCTATNTNLKYPTQYHLCHLARRSVFRLCTEIPANDRTNQIALHVVNSCPYQEYTTVLGVFMDLTAEAYCKEN